MAMATPRCKARYLHYIAPSTTIKPIQKEVPPYSYEHLQKIVCQSYTVALEMVEISAFAPACSRKHCTALLHEYLTVVAAERQRFHKKSKKINVQQSGSEGDRLSQLSDAV